MPPTVMRLSTLALGLFLPAAFAAGQLSPTAPPGPRTAPVRGVMQGETPVPGQDSGEIPGSSDSDEPEVDPSLARSPFATMRAKATDQLAIDILGAWRLESFMAPGTGFDQDDIYGFLIFVNETATTEIHTRSHSSFGGGDELLYFQTSMGRWWFDDAGTLITQSLIGHDNMNDAEVSYEPPGSLREFTLEMPDDETLVFVRDDQARLLYKRLPLRGDGQAQEQAFARRRARARGVDPNAMAGEK